MKKIWSQPVVHLPFHTLASLGERLAWLINLRWVAVIGLLVCVPLSQEMLGFNLPYPQIIMTGVLLLLINILYFFIIRYYPFRNEYEELNFAELQIIADFFIISFIVHFSGGITNPIYFLYLVQVILSGILFPGIVLPYFNAVFAALLLTFWTLSEHYNLIPRFYLLEEPSNLSLTVVSLAAFYLIDFAGIYIIHNFMAGYRALKQVIDEKSNMLEKSIEDRNKAFRYAAHELKSPVIAVQSTLAVIKDIYSSELTPGLKELVLKAENRSTQILNMIKEIIAISQYNLGIEKRELETVDFNLWLDTSLKQHIPYALQKNIKLNYKESAFPFIVEIDVNGMEKIFTNLVNNALRYTPDYGSVTVECFWKKDNYGFSVSDTGIGIETQDLPKIFEEFFRSKKAKEMERIGTGLGLNLVKEVVEFNNGEIKVNSRPGEGTTFTIIFPFGKEQKGKKVTEDDLILRFE